MKKSRNIELREKELAFLLECLEDYRTNYIVDRFNEAVDNREREFTLLTSRILHKLTNLLITIKLQINQSHKGHSSDVNFEDNSKIEVSPQMFR